jgi:hypothetical protein
MFFRFIKRLSGSGKDALVAHTFDIPENKVLLVTNEDARIVSRHNVLLKAFSPIGKGRPERSGMR